MTDAERAVCDCSDPCVRQLAREPPSGVALASGTIIASGTVHHKTACVPAERAACVPASRPLASGVRQDRLRPARPLASGKTACVRQDRLRPARPLASGKTACVRKVMTPMARRSPALFELLEAWVLEDNEKWSGWDMRAMSARRFRPLS